MKKSYKYSLLALGVFFVIGLTGTIIAEAATSPNLGVASGYSVFGNAGITETAGQTSHLWGNAGGNGLGHANLIASQVDGSIDAGANAPVVGAISTAYGDLAGQAQTGAINLATSPVVVPGVYDVGATAFNSTLTLDGAGVYIFRSTSSIAQTAGGTMLLTNGATACNVYWQIPTSMTFAAVGNIEGTIITNTGLISFVSGVALKGRAWAATQVTMDNNQITEPTCAAATGGSSPIREGTINVVKTVINDNGRTKTVADFPLFVGGTPVVSGVTNSFRANETYVVTETSDANYTQSFSGDCDTNGQLNLNSGENKFCIVTNDDVGAPIVVPPVPPLIDVVKVPDPLALPGGTGLVMYTYTLRNIGTVPVTNVTMVGDTCAPIVLVSGDTNADTKLDLNEVWVHRCSTTLTKTHTNTVVATGWANGLSATDIASATVVVGAPVVPPLIHVTKVPSELTLVAGGGMITYTVRITNPGTVPLSNVRLTDDKCSPMKYISGDKNNDSKLDTTESWRYICRSNLTKTTTNTATAVGTANGITVRDFAIATVVVATAVPLRNAAVEVPKIVPALPNTGFGAEGKRIPWAIILLATTSLVVVLRKHLA